MSESEQVDEGNLIMVFAAPKSQVTSDHDIELATGLATDARMMLQDAAVHLARKYPKRAARFRQLAEMIQEEISEIDAEEREVPR